MAEQTTKLKIVEVFYDIKKKEPMPLPKSLKVDGKIVWGEGCKDEKALKVGDVKEVSREIGRILLRRSCVKLITMTPAELAAQKKADEDKAKAEAATRERLVKKAEALKITVTPDMTSGAIAILIAEAK